MDHPYGMFGRFLLQRARWDLPLTRYPNGSPDHRSCSKFESRPQPNSRTRAKSGTRAESRPSPIFGSATHATIHCNGIQ